MVDLRNNFIKIIQIYKKYLSPFNPFACRFYPSCSQYAIDAFKKYEIKRAFFLSLKRVLKCHPFNPGGYNPVE